jgi:hypothetical protein
LFPDIAHTTTLWQTNDKKNRADLESVLMGVQLFQSELEEAKEALKELDDGLLEECDQEVGSEDE